MSNIVVLSNKYLDIPSANGICAKNLVCALRKRGHNVFVVCYEKETLKDEEYQEYIYTIKEPNEDAHHTILNKAFRTVSVMIGSTKPIINEELTNYYYRCLCDICNQVTIDAIIAMYFPFESVEAMRRFISEHSGIKSFVYELDSVGDGVSKKQFLYNIYNSAYEKWLNKVYSEISYTLVMQSHIDYWRGHYGTDFQNKMVLTDYPVLLNRQHTIRSRNNRIKFIYSGIIDKRYRSPSYLLRVLEQLKEKIDFEFHFYSKGDCEDEIADVANRIRGIHQNGYVAPNELNVALSDSDYLVSIGNSMSRAVPSKLITYLGYGKPIIHFASQEDDICLEYLRKYPLALFINQNDNLSESTSKIMKFINETTGKSVDFKEISRNYENNTPDYSAEIIERLIS